MAPSKTETHKPLPPPLTEDDLPPSNETFFQKIWRRSKEEPLIPLGLALTVAALIGAGRAINRKDSRTANLYFRRRVYAQGFTVAATVGGSYYLKDDRERKKEIMKVRADREAAERREAWMQELEAREEEDREASARMEELKERRKKRETWAEALRKTSKAVSPEKDTKQETKQGTKQDTIQGIKLGIDGGTEKGTEKK